MILFSFFKHANFRYLALAIVLAFVGTGLLTSSAQAQGEKSSATVYRADLTPIGGSGVTGKVEIGVKANSIGVSVNAKGFPKGETKPHPQHIHENSGCGDFGGVLVPLDDDLSGEGGSFPTATKGGTVNYQESGPIRALEEAAGGNLDLANRTVVVHKAGGAPAACGALNLVGN